MVSWLQLWERNEKNAKVNSRFVFSALLWERITLVYQQLLLWWWWEWKFVNLLTRNRSVWDNVASSHLFPSVLFDSYTSTRFWFSSSHHFFFVACKSIALSFTVKMCVGWLYRLHFPFSFGLSSLCYNGICISSTCVTLLQLMHCSYKSPFCLYVGILLSLLCFLLASSLFFCTKTMFYKCIPSSVYFVFCDSFPVSYLFCQQWRHWQINFGCPLPSLRAVSCICAVITYSIVNLILSKVLVPFVLSSKYLWRLVLS